MADRSLLHILARIVVLSQHWYNSSAGDGSLVLMGVTQSTSKASCGLALLYLAHWIVCLMDLMHASANPLDCGLCGLEVSCVMPQDIQKSANWALAYCGPLSE